MKEKIPSELFHLVHLAAFWLIALVEGEKKWYLKKTDDHFQYRRLTIF